MTWLIRILCMCAYVVGAPILGGFMSGADRKLSARMQGRIGPRLTQPFYTASIPPSFLPSGKHLKKSSSISFEESEK